MLTMGHEVCFYKCSILEFQTNFIRYIFGPKNPPTLLSYQLRQFHAQPASMRSNFFILKSPTIMYTPIYFCLVLLPFVHSIRIHEFMTPDEVMGIFHTTHDAVPYYEVVPVLYSGKAAKENGTTKMHVRTFNQDIQLHLNPTEGYLASERTPVWSVKSDQQAPEGLHYTFIPNALKDIGIPMQDEETGAALLISFQNSESPIFVSFVLILQFFFLESNLKKNTKNITLIRSMPQRIIKNVLYKKAGLLKHFKEELEENSLAYTYHHIVYKKAPLEENFSKHIYIIFRIFLRQRIIFLEIRNPVSHIYPIPEVIYPEVLVVVDYYLYSMLGKRIDQATRYIIAFWNGVDLRYRELKNPKIRLNIAGIIIAMDEGAVPYIENSRVDSNLVDADHALRGMGSYFYREKRFPWKMYDMALTTTNFNNGIAFFRLNLCIKIDPHLCDPSTMGYAYVAGACNRNRTTKLSEAVGLTEDDGGFSGIIPVAHELGHLLGAYHDGNPKEAGHCSAHDGFIMTSTLILSKHEFEWSNCTINTFHKFLSEDRAKCLYDEPPRSTAVRNLLPGKLMSVDEQCEKVYGGGACNTNSSSICYELNCAVPEGNGLCSPIAAAADGSSCGTGLICLDGDCVLQGTETKRECTYVSQ
ncbi:A disintegrin and metalloproteinase with thrombospondin motifs like [Calliopsis andreniformis]|uniref:A disintegrin and metalloproteinase with thrombospondin motifs like n=1 Tax=Calliopsis andreniformis TaxID=337506 RepID=UPI003FCDB198